MKQFELILKYKDYIDKIDNYDINYDKEILENFKNTIVVEGLIKTQDNVKSLNILLRRFNELEGEIESDGEIFLQGYFNELKKYLPLINNLGYFISKLTYNGKDWIKQYDENSKPLAIFLEAKYDIKIDNVNIPEILYHATDKKNEKRITNYGLIPKSNNKKSNHPERIYLTQDINIAISFGKECYSNFIICKIKTNKLNLYRDINFINNGFYTLDNISKEFIEILNV